MLQEMGMKALQPEMTDQVCRMEYSVFGHSGLPEKATGISTAVLIRQVTGTEVRSAVPVLVYWVRL